MNQDVVNELARRVRREVIFALLKKSFLDHRISMPENEQMAYEIEQIAELPCKTKLLKNLFADAGGTAERTWDVSRTSYHQRTAVLLRTSEDVHIVHPKCQVWIHPQQGGYRTAVFLCVRDARNVRRRWGEDIPKQSDATNNVAMQIRTERQ